MIRDVIIIKDGLPLYTRHINDPESEFDQLFTQHNDIIMMSGFFSALNSFSEEFDNFGPIRELRHLNTELQLSFLKDNKISNLIYLATFDTKSKDVDVQRTLRKVSRSFKEKFSFEQIENWSGKSDYFDAMHDLIDKYVEQEINEHEREFKEKVIANLNQNL